MAVWSALCLVIAVGDLRPAEVRQGQIPDCLKQGHAADWHDQMGEQPGSGLATEHLDQSEPGSWRADGCTGHGDCGGGGATRRRCSSSKPGCGLRSAGPPAAAGQRYRGPVRRRYRLRMNVLRLRYVGQQAWSCRVSVRAAGPSLATRTKRQLGRGASRIMPRSMSWGRCQPRFRRHATGSITPIEEPPRGCEWDDQLKLYDFSIFPILKQLEIIC